MRIVHAGLDARKRRGLATRYRRRHSRARVRAPPVTDLEYAVTRDGERVYVCSRLRLFALGARDGRLRWFALPNEQCTAA
jgi:hypothetical protein